jgi:hypothetical protein
MAQALESCNRSHELNSYAMRESNHGACAIGFLRRQPHGTVGRHALKIRKVYIDPVPNKNQSTENEK